MRSPEVSVGVNKIMDNNSTEEKSEIRYYNNPVDFLSAFEQSEEIKEFFSQREKKVRKIETKKEIESLLRGTNEYKIKLWAFFHNNRLSWVTGNYSADFITKIESYWRFLRSGSADEKYMRYGNVEEVDKERSRLHLKAAEQLMSDFNIDNHTVARILVQFLSIDRGFDFPDPDRDIRRRQVGTLSSTD